MSQNANLIRNVDAAQKFSLKVGTVTVVPNTLYTLFTDGTLVQAGDNEGGPLFLPTSPETPGMSVQALLVGTFTAPLLASGGIAAKAALAPAALGAVRTATTGDRVIGYAMAAALDGELVTAITGGSSVIGPATNKGANGESIEETWVSEEITLATGGATSLSSANLLPANSLIVAAVIRVTQAINNAAAFIVGASAGDLDGLVATGTALTLNATAVGAGALIGTFNVAANTVTITTSGGTQNTTGKVRVSVLVRKLTAPTS